MSADAKSPVVLLSLPTEGEAVVICEALRDAGVSARVVGGPISSFRAAAPGSADVLVEGDQVERAKEALAAIRAPFSERDWSEVDVGEEESGAEAQPADQRALAEPKAEPDTGTLPEPTKVIQGRLVFLFLISADLLLTARGFLHFGFHSWWSLVAVSVFWALWYACWRGCRWAVRIQVIIGVLAFASGCFPPYEIEGLSTVPGTALCGITVVALTFSPTLKEFFRYQRALRGKGK